MDNIMSSSPSIISGIQSNSANKCVGKIIATFEPNSISIQESSQKSSQYAPIYSTGTIIGRNLVITCASSLHHESNAKVADKIWFQYFSEEDHQTPIKLQVKRFYIPNEHFDENNTGKSEFDFALLLLQNPNGFQFNQIIRIKSDQSLTQNVYKKLNIIWQQKSIGQNKIHYNEQELKSTAQQAGQLICFQLSQHKALPGSPLIQKEQSEEQFLAGIYLGSIQNKNYGLLLGTSFFKFVQNNSLLDQLIQQPKISYDNVVGNLTAQDATQILSMGLNETQSLRLKQNSELQRIFVFKNQNNLQHCKDMKQNTQKQNLYISKLDKNEDLKKYEEASLKLLKLLNQNQFEEFVASYQKQKFEKDYKLYNKNIFWQSYVKTDRLNNNQIEEIIKNLSDQSISLIDEKLVFNKDKDDAYHNTKLKQLSEELKPTFQKYCQKVQISQWLDSEQTKKKLFWNQTLQPQRQDTSNLQQTIGFDVKQFMKFNMPKDQWKQLGLDEKKCPYTWKNIRSKIYGGTLNNKNGFFASDQFNEIYSHYQSLGQNLYWSWRTLKYEIEAQCVEYESKSFEEKKFFALACKELNMKVKYPQDFIISIDNQSEKKMQTVELQVVNNNFDPFTCIRPLIMEEVLLKVLFYKNHFKIKNNVKKLLQANLSSDKQIDQLIKPSLSQYYGGYQQGLKGLNTEGELREYRIQRQNQYQKNKQYLGSFISTNEGVKILKVFGLEIPCQFHENTKQNQASTETQYSNLKIAFNGQVAKNIFSDKLKSAPQWLVEGGFQKYLPSGDISFITSEQFVGIMLKLSFDISITETLNNFLKSTLKVQKSKVINLSGGTILSDNIFKKPRLPHSFILRGKISDEKDKSSNPNLIEHKKSTEFSIKEDFVFQGVSVQVSLPLGKNTKMGVSMESTLQVYNISKDPIVLSSMITYGEKKVKVLAHTSNEIKQFFGIKALTIQKFNLEFELGSRNSLDLEFNVLINKFCLKFYGSINDSALSIRCFIDNLSINDFLTVVEYFTNKKFNTDYNFNFKSLNFILLYDRKTEDLQLKFECKAQMKDFKFKAQIQYKKGILKLYGKGQVYHFGKVVTLKNSQILLNIPINSQKSTELNMKGAVVCKTFESLQIQAQGEIAVQFSKEKKSWEYELLASINFWDLKDTLEDLNKISVLNKILYYYRTQNFISKQIKNKQRRNCLIVALDQIPITSNQFLRIEADIDFSNKKISAKGLVERKIENPNALILFESFELSATLQKSFKLGLSVTANFPKYNNIKIKGSLIIDTVSIIAQLEMWGVLELTQHIKFGFQQSTGKHSQLSLGLTGSVISQFTISGNIEFYKSAIRGDISYQNGILERVYFSTTTLTFDDIIKLIFRVCSLPQDIVPEFPVILKELTVDINFKQLSYQFILDLEIFDNRLTAKSSLNSASAQFMLSANIEHAIRIGCLCLAKQKGSVEGPFFDMKLNKESSSLHLQAYAQLGPFGFHTKITIQKNLFHFLFEFSFLTMTVSIQVKYQKTLEYTKGQFQFKYETQDHKKKVNGYIQNSYKDSAEAKYKADNNLKGKKLLKIQDQMENYYNLCQNLQKSCQQQIHHQKVKLSSYNKQRQAYLQQMKQTYEKYYQKLQNLHEMKQQYLKRKQQQQNQQQFLSNKLSYQTKLLQSNDLQATNNSGFRLQVNEQINLLEVQSSKVQHSLGLTDSKLKDLQIEQSILNKNFETRKQQFQFERQKQLNFMSQVRLQGIGSFFKWFGQTVVWIAKKVVDTVAKLWDEMKHLFEKIWQKIKEIVPHISLFRVYGSDEYNNKTKSFKFQIGFQLEGTFFGNKVKINKKLQSASTSKDPQLMNNEFLTNLINISLDYVNSFYFIPRPIFQKQNRNDIYFLRKIIKNQDVNGLSYDKSIYLNERVTIPSFGNDVPIPNFTPICINSDQIKLGQCKKYHLFREQKVCKENNDFILAIYTKVNGFTRIPVRKSKQIPLHLGFIEYDTEISYKSLKLLSSSIDESKNNGHFTNVIQSMITNKTFDQKYLKQSYQKQIAPSRLKRLDEEKILLRDFTKNDFQIDSRSNDSQARKLENAQLDRIASYLKESIDAQKNYFSFKTQEQMKKIGNFVWKLQHLTINGESYVKICKFIENRLTSTQNKYYLACYKIDFIQGQPVSKQIVENVFFVSQEYYIVSQSTINIYWRAIDCDIPKIKWAEIQPLEKEEIVS